MVYWVAFKIVFSYIQELVEKQKNKGGNLFYSEFLFVLGSNVAICTFETSEVEMFSSFLWHHMPCYFHRCQLSAFSILFKILGHVGT
jgi:hypothetical protein